MNKLNYYFYVLALIMLSGIVSQSVNAGSKENTLASLTGNLYSHTELANGDSLPAGVTKDWLKDLRDENGNKITNDNEIGRSREEPETDALQKRIFSGSGTSYSHFGYSISDAGDVNGDGYDDIIVGAYYFPYPDLNGRAYIYYGGLNMNTVPDVIITGENNNDQFGISVSGAGDMNGDGYDDVIVGAYGFNSGTGRAYIYFGSANMNNTADVILNGQSGGDFFGHSVSKAGDFNGDGFGDVIVGAQGYDTYAYTGRVYLFLGGLTVDSVADFVVTGEGTLNYFGYSVSDAGDVNGDGFSDIIVGAHNISKAYIYYGSTALDTVPDLTLSYEFYINFGESVSSAGDVNGDGFGDVIVGASTYSGFGGAFLFFGGASMNNNYDVVLEGFEWGSNFGRSVSSAGDINGDGFSDVVIGAGYSGIGLRGKVYVYFGGFLMNNVADITMEGESDYEYLGNSVSSAGDVNGDGYSDVIAGAHGYSSNTGRVYLYDYFMKGEILSDVTMTGETTSYFGASVSTAGDVNGDGYSDVVVGAYKYSSFTGRAYIFFGGAYMDNIADVTMTGEAENSSFCISGSSAGDVNGDGYSDVIVGASNYSSGAGRAYIYFGGSSMNNVADVIMTGEEAYIFFGRSVSSAGDVNGDGYSDVIVGAYGYSSGAGRAYIYLGGSSMNNVADVTLTGEAANIFFGQSVSSAGDVNGDGYSDVIIGAYGYSSNAGRAYIYFGNSSMNNVADVIMTGEAAYIFFGRSVSSAGDVNGDGYSDVIVGASYYSSNTGRAYIYFGGSSMNNVADVTMTGEAENSDFGSSGSSAGDVNGDGYSDVIVGAHGYSSSAGRAYIYFGGSSMNNVADVTMTGEAEYSSFGTSGSSAGDVNGDGYSDLIVGAFTYSISTGRAYLFLGSAISAKPILIFVKDVPNDQGGKVNLKWARSSFDVAGSNSILNYAVYRSYPPVGGNFSWEEIYSMTSSNHSFYTYTTSTPYDSGSGNTGNMFYKIRARTSNASVYWESAILSGRSIDNIAPLMVSPFTAVSTAPDVLLNWKRNTAPDLLNYVLYRSTSPVINPDTEPVFATTTDTTYLDTAPLGGLYYYFIVAQDIHTNKSPVAVAESPGMTLNLTMFIEGMYNAGSNSQVNDTITVELRNTVLPFAVADVEKAVVGTNGSSTLKFGTAPDGNYYLAVRHRNIIETWSSAPVALSRITPASYNLSTSASQSYGSNMIQVDATPVRFAIYSGDVNQDGTIDATDVSTIDNDASNFVSGYVVTDLTGDDFVDGTDFAIADNNAANFVSVVRP